MRLIDADDFFRQFPELDIEPYNNVSTIEPKRKFIQIITTYYPDDLICYDEYKGKPYLSIAYQENGEVKVGYGTYNPDVLSRYLRDYFINEPSAEPRYSYNDLESMIIYGYPVKDLAILAQRMHSDGLDPQTLHNSNEDYLAGYRRAYEESNKALEDAFRKMFDDIPKDL